MQKKNEMLFKARRFRFDFSKKRKVLIVGILNITPDSFSDGNRYSRARDAYKQALRLEAEGANIIDIGAESTRPGSSGVSESEELRRLISPLEKIISKVKIPISIDTSKACVADECLRIGASIINDISGLRRDSQMASVIKKYKAGAILMHMRGKPSTMQSFTHYDNLIKDILRELKESIKIGLNAGIEFNRLVIDPGIGFSKTAEQNLEIIHYLKKFLVLKRPVLLGPSRKSFIGAVLNRNVDERLSGTLASLGCAVNNGVNMVRVHDVKAVSDFLKMMHAINSV